MTKAFQTGMCGAFLLALMCAGACSDSGGDDGGGDAMVTAVDCASVTPAMSITTPGNSYSPAQAMIPVGGVIKWTLPAQHDVSSTTPGLAVDFGETKCLKFSAAGQYGYKCSVHGFTGMVVVQ